MTTAVAKRKSLGDLLTTLQAHDQGLLNFTEEQQKEVVDELVDKVDAYKYVDEKFDKEMKRIADQIEVLQGYKKSLDANKKSLRKLMAWFMSSRKFKMLPGQQWRVSLVEKEDVITTLGDADSKMYLKYPELVERTYSWNINKVKALVKSDPKKYKHLGKIEESNHVSFTERRNLLDEKSE